MLITHTHTRARADAGDGAPLTSPDAGDGAPLTSPDAGDGAPLTSPDAGDGAPLTSGVASDGAPLTSLDAGDGAPLTSGVASDGAPLTSGVASDGAPLTSGVASDGAPLIMVEGDGGIARYRGASEQSTSGCSSASHGKEAEKDENRCVSTGRKWDQNWARTNNLPQNVITNIREDSSQGHTSCSAMGSICPESGCAIHRIAEHESC